MHIKQIELSGFKSYKDRLESSSFSPKINVVVGANGSGKSNFFHAIRFVLNDVNNMRQEERQQLLHEGAGHAVSQAYVEVVFDNSDGRFPIDRDEVRLRRTISKGKDEYHLDKKIISKNEVANLLESAGFSRANPYYIVQQGKIMAMSNMKDTERLALLKEIGGTGVYEERRKESLKVMEDTEARRTQIEETMSVIEAKLKELDDERQELAEYILLDKQRRSIEYSMVDADLILTRSDMAKLEEEQLKARESTKKVEEEAAKSAAERDEVEKNVSLALAEKTELERQRKQIKARKAELARSVANSEGEVHDLEAQVKRGEEGLSRVQRETGKLASDIKEAQAKLAGAKSAHAKAEAEEFKIHGQLDAAESRLKQLYERQGRDKSFASQKERDAWLNKEIGSLDGTLSQEEKRVRGLEEQMKALQDRLLSFSKELADKEAEAKGSEDSSLVCDRKLQELRTERDALQNGRKEAWRIEAELRVKVESMQAELKKRRSNLESHIARDISRGLQGLDKVIQEHNVMGVHGRLIDLIDCPPQISTAVEVTAGNSLFHIVVESDDVALRCSELLNRGKLGRVTFMPLNTLQPSDMQYPTEYGSDVVPLAKKIKCEQRFEKAVKQIFGKTVLCRTVDVATTVAHAGTFNCVTIDGIQVNKRGAITGGYHDPSASRIDTLRAVKAQEKDVDEKLKGLSESEVELRAIDSRIAALSGEIHKEEAKRQHLRSQFSSLKDEVRAVRRDQGLKQKDLEGLEKEVAKAKQGLTKLQARIDALKSDLGTQLHANLTNQERAEADSLPSLVASLRDRLRAAGNACSKASALFVSLESLLNDDLLKRKDEMEGEGQGAKLQSDRQLLGSSTSELASLKASLKSAQAEDSQLDQRFAAAVQKLADATKAKETLIEDEDKKRKEAAKTTNWMETLASRRSVLTAREADLLKRIKDLGSLPSEAFEGFKGKSKKHLQKLLEKVTEDLSKFGNVNRKALDMYTSFTDQRKELAARKVELDSSEDKILELIAALDMRKDEAIERTFKGVAKHFRDVFAELVPGGRGELVMQKRLPGGGVVAAAADDDDEAPAAAPAPAAGAAGGAMEKYSGVKVRISFTRGGETMSLKQLSGGQRTLVALALIFSIQRCDPAPFYLFDEIDAALDPQYRTTVAKMLRRQADEAKSGGAQFIVTTFHPQIVAEADRLYGVSHTNRVSTVHLIKTEDAMAFLQVPEDHHHGEAGPSGTQQPLVQQQSQGAQVEGEEEEEEEEEEEPSKKKSRPVAKKAGAGAGAGAVSAAGSGEKKAAKSKPVAAKKKPPVQAKRKRGKKEESNEEDDDEDEEED